MLVLKAFKSGEVVRGVVRIWFNKAEADRDPVVFDGFGSWRPIDVAYWTRKLSGGGFVFPQDGWAWMYIGNAQPEVNEFGPVTP